MEGMEIKRFSIILGVFAGTSSIILFFFLHFMNPYNNAFQTGAFVNTLLTLFLPACLALLAVIKTRHIFMLIAFIWSLPISLYISLTPGVFAFFGLTNLCYLISFLLAYLHHKRIHAGE
ncbi:hypothetical protein SAMN05216225_104415 [Ornithinibacillus halophilus]|uniref:Uncharacterized protein n=2 Tax=Ornithinibacillus halophilus TaxID=930117 RepID=A0A1M5L534_9BACI|nr:hypothetical protein SAMN05216225_104415 [Ornithinibacillus halophilus]